MKKLLATTAIALLTAAPLSAQTATTTAPATDGAMADTGIFLPGMADGIRASRFIGKTVYASESDIAPELMADASADWANVGEISDVLISKSGDVDVVLVDVGGFLGIGEKTVAVKLSDIQSVPDSDTADAYYLVFKGSKAELEGAPAFTEDAKVTTAGDGTVAAPAADTATAPAADTAMADGTTATAGTPMTADMASMTADQLAGATVRGTNDETIGEVSDIVLDGNKVTGVVVDVGGFLGMGEKRVTLSPEMVDVKQEADGATPIIIVKATKEELKALPDYAG